MTKLRLYVILAIGLLSSCRHIDPPAAYGPTPTTGQLQWHEVDFYGMICLSTITYTDQEWGYGDEAASLFNPDKFDAQEMVGIMKDAGMKGILVVAKHHGGFCLWPTSTTGYSVKNSPWRNGQGDMVKEFADAAQEHGLKFGVYLSPWDRNDPDYGTEKYIERYREQLRELHSNYGDVFLSWFDGANGGSGYYGGAREHREIDRALYYDWENTWQLVRKLQPNSAIFSDIGWDVRWVGNEAGFAGDPCWATYTPKGLNGNEPGCGSTEYQEGIKGHRDGKYWMPAECDVPIRPGWFYHNSQNNDVKSPETLFDLYFMSVGRGAALDLGLAPDRSGQLHTSDSISLKGLGKLLTETFSVNLAKDARIEASQVRGGSKDYAPLNLLDNNKQTYWSTNDAISTGELTITLPQPTRFNIVSIREYLPLGQRVDSARVDIFDGKEWIEYAKVSSIGAQRLIRKEPVETSKVRLYTWGPVCPALSEFGLYLEPKRVSTPVVSRNIQGMVSINNLNPRMAVYYTLDGSDPASTSARYLQPIPMQDGGTLKLVNIDEGTRGSIISLDFGIAKAGWKMIPDNQDKRAFDENISTVWQAGNQLQELCIDLNQETDISALVYTPPATASKGLVSKYAVYISSQPGKWGEAVTKGEFDNIRNNPLPQTIRFEKPVTGRYVRFAATGTIDNAPMLVAEIDVLK